MNNLTLFLIGLVLIYIPASLSKNNNKNCFSQSLSPPYPCCTGNQVLYTDEDGDWGVENDQWCGIGNSDACFSVALGYSCCESCEVLYTDDDGDWGVENDKWCGIKDSCDTTEDNNGFDFSFLKLENEKKNMIYSPLSIKIALKMLQEGADGNTYKEINNVVGNKDISKYSNIDKILSIANGLFIKDDFYDYVKPEYINTLNKKYDAEIKKDEFKNAQNVNSWIEDKTLGIIKNMLKDEMFKNKDDSELVMLLINALAVDLEWANPFSIRSTYGRTFYLDNGEKLTATTMSKYEVASDYISFSLKNDITVLAMDSKNYNGTQFEFMAIMPKENLSAFVENVSEEQINQIGDDLILSSDGIIDGINLTIPRFKFNYDLKLKDDLKKLGINDAFNPGANFSKMALTDLYVSEALHKAEIDIAEKGVKAAAVTVIGMNAPTAVRPKEKFIVDVKIDKPFMFVIRDKNTKDIWFTGTVYEPNSWNDDKETYEKEIEEENKASQRY